MSYFYLSLIILYRNNDGKKINNIQENKNIKTSQDESNKLDDCKKIGNEENIISLNNKNNDIDDNSNNFIKTAEETKSPIKQNSLFTSYLHTKQVISSNISIPNLIDPNPNMIILGHEQNPDEQCCK
jgi:hypothetical protein